jgi:hypothetical protein
MNPSLLAALGTFLVVLLWWRGRRQPPMPLLRNPDASAVAALNRAQIALTQAAGPRSPGASSASTHGTRTPTAAQLDGKPLDLGSSPPALGPALWLGPPLRRDSHAQRLYRSWLEASFRAGGAERLEAVRQARRWGHRSTLPLLRQGLRATDPAVVREAAAALERFRGPMASMESPPLGRPLQPAGAGLRRMPRSVARTR